MIDATAIILTKDEEKNIEQCIESMKGFAKRCVVIDCGSQDSTVELAKKSGADVYFHEFEYYAKQFNWAINNTDIKTEWIIRLDADERFPEELKNEIEKHIINNKGTEMNGLTISADLYFMGRRLKYGAKNKLKMMLFKKKYGYIEDRRRDAHSVLKDGFSVETKNRFIHHDFKNLDIFIRRYNWYATREMQDYIEYINGKQENTVGSKSIQNTKNMKFKVYYNFPKFFRAFLLFIYVYIFKLGFCDGVEGLIFNFFDTFWYRFLVDAKIKEYEINGGVFEKLEAFQ